MSRWTADLQTSNLDPFLKRIERTSRNREKSKLMNEKKQKAWESLEE